MFVHRAASGLNESSKEITPMLKINILNISSFFKVKNHISKNILEAKP